MNLPIWWKSDFYDAQGLHPNFFRHAAVPVVGFFKPKSLEIGFIGPYGGVFSDNLDKTLESWSNLVAVNPGVVKVRLLQECLFPDEYNANLAALKYLNFKNVYSDLVAIVNLQGYSRESLNRNRLREINQIPIGDLKIFNGQVEKSFTAIEKNRLQKQLSITINLNRLVSLSKLLPREFFAFHLEDIDGQILAGCIAYAVDDSKVYIYLWGHDRTSPLASKSMGYFSFLILEYFSIKGFLTADLGTCSVAGIVDQGLVAFKSSLGANFYTRETYLISKL
jgi:hypothetical protein